jgi:type IV secretion system protein TrbF
MQLSLRLEERLARWVLRRAEPSTSAGALAPPPPPPGALRENPFVAARDEFTNAFGDLAKGKRNWQVIAFVAMSLLALVTLAYVELARSARLVPYVVQVDRLGQVVGAGAADELKRPDERLIRSELAQFVRAIRTVLPAAAASAQAELLRRGYAFVTPPVAGFLNDYFAAPEHDPRLLGTRLSRQVDVASVLRLPNSDVWRLQWTETERAIEPATAGRTVAWEGYASVKLVPLRSPEAVEENPLGLAVTSLSWTRVAEGAPAPPSPTSPGALRAPFVPTPDSTPIPGAMP